MYIIEDVSFPITSLGSVNNLSSPERMLNVSKFGKVACENFPINNEAYHSDRIFVFDSFLFT